MWFSNPFFLHRGRGGALIREGRNLFCLRVLKASHTAGYSSFCSLDEDPLYVHNAKCTVIDLDAFSRELDFEGAAIDLEEPFVMIIFSTLIFIALLRGL